MYVCVYGVVASACMPECRHLWSPVAEVAEGQKTVADPLQLELQAAVVHPIGVQELLKAEASLLSHGEPSLVLGSFLPFFLLPVSQEVKDSLSSALLPCCSAQPPGPRDQGQSLLKRQAKRNISSKVVL